MAVTRTISVGAIYNNTKPAPDDFMSSRRHSSAGMRALLWATNSAKSLGSSFGSECQTSRETIFPNILTPDSIPQFTIPSLSLQAGMRLSETSRKGDETDTDEGFGSSGRELASPLSVSPTCSSSSVVSLSPPDRKAQRSVSEPLTKKEPFLKRDGSFPCSYMEAQHCLDPTSWAALSLPHLAKVTTPYGFVTLSQSPQMASEEALLCQAGVRRLKRDEEALSFHSKTPVTRTQAVNIQGSSSRQPATWKRLSKDLTDSQTQRRLSKEESQSAASSCSTSTSSSSSFTHRQATKSKPKRSYYEIIRKHLMSHH